MVLWILKHSPNFDPYAACSECGSFLCFLRNVHHRVVDNGVERLYVDLLYAVNCFPADGDQYFCTCGARVGYSENMVIVFDQYVRPETFSTEPGFGLMNELDVSLALRDESDLVIGCSYCCRPIGYGENFLTRTVSSLELVNVKYHDGAIIDDIFYREDGLRILCQCGAYIGYMHSIGHVILGAFISLASRFAE